MSDWTSGYVADIGYTYGYYAELNPVRSALALLNAGVAVPNWGAACELGFGQGMSANMHAAAQPGVRYWGTDFNPAQAAFAQSLAEVSGSGAQLFDQSFEEFCERADLPDFDYIGLHGIWSWISDDNRRIIVDFIRRKLKVGGVLYVSYNTQPGWASMVPLRHLLTQHADVMGSPGQGILSRIDGSLAFANKLLETNPSYARANAQVPERLKKLTEQNRHYLAHEYFNRDWNPMHFANMEEWLTPAKLSFACSAFYIDHIDAVNLTAEQQTLLNEIPDLMFRESVRDFMVNQQFRRDYWVKGARKLSVLDQAEALRKQRVILTTSRADVSLKVIGALGEAVMQEAVYNPILDVLADHTPKTLGQIEEALKDKTAIAFAQILQAVMVLIGSGALQPAQDKAVISKAKTTTDKLNADLLDKARGNADVSYLVSPVTGSGIVVTRFQQLFLLARTKGAQQPADWAAYAWKVLAAQGQSLVIEGKTLDSPEKNLAELTEQATKFAGKQLPVLQKLGIA